MHAIAHAKDRVPPRVGGEHGDVEGVVDRLVGGIPGAPARGSGRRRFPGGEHQHSRERAAGHLDRARGVGTDRAGQVAGPDARRAVAVEPGRDQHLPVDERRLGRQSREAVGGAQRDAVADPAHQVPELIDGPHRERERGARALRGGDAVLAVGGAAPGGLTGEQHLKSREWSRLDHEAAAGPGVRRGREVGAGETHRATRAPEHHTADPGAVRERDQLGGDAAGAGVRDQERIARVVRHRVAALIGGAHRHRLRSARDHRRGDGPEHEMVCGARDHRDAGGGGSGDRAAGLIADRQRLGADGVERHAQRARAARQRSGDRGERRIAGGDARDVAARKRIPVIVGRVDRHREREAGPLGRRAAGHAAHAAGKRGLSRRHDLQAVEGPGMDGERIAGAVLGRRALDVRVQVHVAAVDAGLVGAIHRHRSRPGSARERHRLGSDAAIAVARDLLELHRSGETGHGAATRIDGAQRDRHRLPGVLVLLRDPREHEALEHERAHRPRAAVGDGGVGLIVRLKRERSRRVEGDGEEPSPSPELGRRGKRRARVGAQDLDRVRHRRHRVPRRVACPNRDVERHPGGLGARSAGLAAGRSRRRGFTREQDLQPRVGAGDRGGNHGERGQPEHGRHDDSNCPSPMHLVSSGVIETNVWLGANGSTPRAKVIVGRGDDRGGTERRPRAADSCSSPRETSPSPEVVRGDDANPSQDAARAGARPEKAAGRARRCEK